MKLKAYQVGDNDIVAAYSTDQALNIYVSTCVGWTVDDFEAEELIEYRLTLPTYDEDGCEHESVQEMLDNLDKPQYMFGWE